MKPNNISASRWFTRLKFSTIVIGVLIGYLGFVGHVRAQIGSTPKQMAKMFPGIKKLSEDELDRKFKTYSAYGVLPLLNPVYGTTLPSRFRMTFENDKVVCTRISEKGGFKAVSYDNTQLLSNYSWYMRGTRRKGVKWESPNAFLHLFPPIGEWSANLIAKTIPTGMMSRTRTIDTRTGQTISTTPWSAMEIPTGEFIQIGSKDATLKKILVSTDGQLYAMVTVQLLTGLSGVVTEDSEQSISGLMICDARFFWRYVFSNIEEGFDLTEYEEIFKKVVPKKRHSKVHAHRLKIAVAMATVMSDIPLKELHAKVGSSSDEYLKSFSRVVAVKGKKFTTEQQLRQIDMLADVGDAGSVLFLYDKMRNSKLKSSAIAAMKKIAARHTLPGLPADDADLKLWRKWAQSMKK